MPGQALIVVRGLLLCTCEHVPDHKDEATSLALAGPFLVRQKRFAVAVGWAQPAPAGVVAVSILSQDDSGRRPESAY
jgi:hypothetical protein